MIALQEGRDQQSHARYLVIAGISKHKGLSTIRDAFLMNIHEQRS